jgi:hypothetical protein
LLARDPDRRISAQEAMDHHVFRLLQDQK